VSLSWAWVDPKTGEEAHEDGERVLPAASTIKLFVASAFWRSSLDPDEQVDAVRPAGSAGVAEYLSPAARLTLGDLALLMLAVSDNAATNVLLDRLGFDAVNAEIARLGLDRTVVRRPMMTPGPENETCALDLARGLARVLEEPRIPAAPRAGARLPASPPPAEGCPRRREDRRAGLGLPRGGAARQRPSPPGDGRLLVRSACTAGRRVRPGCCDLANA
jgi:hypothetical protein